jgi:pyruvate/2-oxoglutarate dehydrogenase complex dihydrolipoamide dehydrogenase (E3) component
VPVWTPRSGKLSQIVYGQKLTSSKSFQKILAKQGIKFKLNTKVISASREGDKVSVKVDAAKGGKEETVCSAVSSAKATS